MKRSGRTLKQRLYGLKHLPSRVRRARYFRGHGVHSPYVYAIVRQVFMQKRLLGEDHSLHDRLLELGVSRRRAVQLDNLMAHCGYKSCSVDEKREVDMIVATLATTCDCLEEYVSYAREVGATLCVMSPYKNAQRWEVCRRLIEEHPSTTVDNRGYLLFFNNHLPKQRFRL
mgnify:CR=1 FL=1